MDKTPMQLIAELLAEMTGRAVEAERLLAEEKASSDTWYKSWQNEKAEKEKFRKMLEEEIFEHQETKRKLRHADETIDVMNGVHDSGGTENEPF